MEDTAVYLRIDVAAGERRSFNIAVMIEIVNTVIRLGVIQPESIDAVIVVFLLAYVPDIFSCLRIEHVDLNAVTLEIVCLLFRADYPCMFFILLDFFVCFLKFLSDF